MRTYLSTILKVTYQTRIKTYDHVKVPLYNTFGLKSYTTLQKDVLETVKGLFTSPDFRPRHFAWHTTETSQSAGEHTSHTGQPSPPPFLHTKQIVQTMIKTKPNRFTSRFAHTSGRIRTFHLSFTRCSIHSTSQVQLLNAALLNNNT